MPIKFITCDDLGMPRTWIKCYQCAYYGKAICETSPCGEGVYIDTDIQETKQSPLDTNFYDAFKTMQFDVHLNAKEHGWYDIGRSDGELIALEHSELSEVLEALREGNEESDKIPGYSKAVEELADAVIRIMDHCAYRGWNLAGAILAKHEFNKSRPHRHGGKRF